MSNAGLRSHSIRSGSGKGARCPRKGARTPPPPRQRPTANSPSPGQPTPGVVKQDKSSGGSVDTTKTRSGPQRVRMSGGERPIGAAKGKQSDTEALCQTPPPPHSSPESMWLDMSLVASFGLLFPSPSPGWRPLSLPWVPACRREPYLRQTDGRLMHAKSVDKESRPSLQGGQGGCRGTKMRSCCPLLSGIHADI